MKYIAVETIDERVAQIFRKVRLEMLKNYKNVEYHDPNLKEFEGYVGLIVKLRELYAEGKPKMWVEEGESPSPPPPMTGSPLAASFSSPKR